MEEKNINKTLMKYDEEQNKREEEHFANKYNLRSNPDFEEDVYVGDWFVAIEEEDDEEDLPAKGKNNNIGVNPPVDRDPPTGDRWPPTDRPTANTINTTRSTNSRWS